MEKEQLNVINGKHIYGFGVPETWVQILIHILKSHVTVGLLLNLPAPKFPIQNSGGNSSLEKMFQVVFEMIHACNFSSGPLSSYMGRIIIVYIFKERIDYYLEYDFLVFIIVILYFWKEVDTDHLGRWAAM